MRASAISMPFVEVPFLAALLVELHQRFDIGRRRGTAERVRREVGDDLPRAGRLVRRARRRADEDLAAARRVFRLRRVERTFDADRADVREEREAGRRTGLQRVAHEVLIEIEQRREVRLQERRAEHVLAGRRLHPHLHSVAAEIARRLCPRLPAATWRAAAIGRRGQRPPPCQSSICEALAVEQDFELLARHRTESGRRHVVAEDRRHRELVLAVGRENMR